MKQESVDKLVGPEWGKLLYKEFNRSYVSRLQRIVKAEREQYNIFPEPDNVFKAFKLTPPHKVKVIMLGQDPYYTPKTATGLAFASEGEFDYLPPSLKNIIKERETDLGFDGYNLNPNLESWAKQGVLLLNTILTVRQGLPLSHAHIGWELFVYSALERLAEQPLVYLCLGQKANAIALGLCTTNQRIFRTVHPSPRSANDGFFYSSPFSSTNELLSTLNLKPINW